MSDADNRLDRRPITTGVVQDDQLVVRDGLEAGDLVVLSDPRPAIIGMKLDPLTVEQE